MRHPPADQPKQIKHLIRPIICIILFLLPLVVSSTPPEPPPYARHIINGTITRPGGGNLDNYVAILQIKKGCSSPDSFTTIDPGDYRTAGNRVDNRIDLTDTLGAFQLRVTVTSGIACRGSLAVGIILPTQEILIGEPFAIEGRPSGEDIETREKDKFMCDEKYNVTMGYLYRYPDQTVMIP